MKSKQLRSSFLLLLTSIIWGVAFVAQRTGADFVGAFTFNGVRFALGALVLLPIIYVFERSVEDKKRRYQSVRAGLFGGIVLFSASALQQFGVGLTGSAGKSGFITGLYIVIVPIFGIFLGKKTNLFVWVGAASACVGLYLLSVRSGFGAVELGDTLLFTGALLWAVHILIIDRFAAKVSPISFSASQYTVCSAFSLVCAFIFEEVTVKSILAGYIPILYTGLLSVGIAYTLQVFGQRYVEPSKAALIISLETLFAVLGGALILGERMELVDYIGCALIFVGIVISQTPRKERLIPDTNSLHTK